MIAAQQLQERRLEELLRRQLGTRILAAIGDPQITEIIVNEDGRVWFESYGKGMHEAGLRLAASQVESLIGTVTLLLHLPPNQPHRAEIAKMMTRISHRGRGVATALMLVAERLAVERGRTLLVLDTAVEGGASGLYEGLGFQLSGVIPDYALKPHGGLTGTIIYWKRPHQGAPG